MIFQVVGERDRETERIEKNAASDFSIVTQEANRPKKDTFKILMENDSPIRNLQTNRI